MENEYVIINKTAIQKRIKEIEVQQKKLIKDLKKLYDALGRNTNTYFSYKENISRYFTALTNEKRLLQSILKQSTPLIPVIEGAFESGWDGKGEFWLDKKKQDYLSNLKLDI